MIKSVSSSCLLMTSSLSLALQLLVLQFVVCEARRVGDCAQPVIDGARCHQRSRSWQHDGVCITPQGYCNVPDTRVFKFALIARLRQLQRPRGSKPVKKLWIRGSGPGLSWEKSIELKRTASTIDTWKLELSYTSNSDALPCKVTTHCAFNQGALEFRLYRDELALDDMLGPNFYISLPISHSMFGATDFLLPEVTVYPWFDGKTITLSEFEISSSRYVTGVTGEIKPKVTIMYPPSYHFNVRKSYPLVIIFGTREPVHIAPLLEHMYVHEASIQEAVVVSIHYMDPAPFCMFNPFPDGSKTWVCKTWQSRCHTCQSCWDPRRAERCERQEFMDKVDNCLRTLHCYGRADQILDFIELDLLPQVAERTLNRVQLDFPRQRISIIGFDGAGLLSCYAVLTRPMMYAKAGCLSAPFFWPLISLTEAQPGLGQVFQQLNESFWRLPPLRAQYLHQQYYIDVGERDNHYFPTIDPYQYAEQFINNLTGILKLKMDEHIVYSTVPGAGNSYYHHPNGGEEVLHRIKYPLLYFLKAKGGPNNQHARMQKITESWYAQHDGKEPSSEEEVAVLNDTRRGHCLASEHDTIHGTVVPIPIYLASIGKCTMTVP